MKYLIILTAAAAFSALGVIANAAEDPFADVVETRHGLMLQMAVDLSKIADLNAAAVALQPMAVADLERMKAGMAGLGKACGACHSAYRLTEN